MFTMKTEPQERPPPAPQAFASLRVPSTRTLPPLIHPVPAHMFPMDCCLDGSSGCPECLVTPGLVFCFAFTPRPAASLAEHPGASRLLSLGGGGEACMWVLAPTSLSGQQLSRHRRPWGEAAGEMRAGVGARKT